MRSVTMIFAAAITLAVPAASAQQNDQRGFSLGFAGGFSVGQNERSNPSTIGYYVLTALEFPSPVRVLGLRADALYADWGASKVTAVTANVLFTPMSGRALQPYAIIGGGGYKPEASTMKSGWTMGLGLRLPSQLHAITVETRVHSFIRVRSPNLPATSADDDRWRYVLTPIGLGIQF